MKTAIGNTSRTFIVSGCHRRRIVLFILVVLAVIPAIDASYMLGKAKLAQLLITFSWKSENHVAKPWPWADTYPVAKLTVPEVNLQTWVLTGASGHSLSFGPGLVDGSVPAGAPGVLMIAGHRDTSFQPLQNIVIGHLIFLQDRTGTRFTYRVTDISVADARYSSISPYTTDPTLVLVTCYPFNALSVGGPMRYVVQATLTHDVRTHEVQAPDASLHDTQPHDIPAHETARAQVATRAAGNVTVEVGTTEPSKAI